jgi:hypothetical protein
LVEVKQGPATFSRDPAQRFIELRTAVATRRTQDIAGNALGVNAHEHVPPISNLTAHKGDVGFLSI